MRVVFLGTPEFAVPSLNHLISNGHEIAAVFTQPDRAKGRGKEVFQAPVKRVANQAGLPIYQPERIRRVESIELLKSIAPDLMVVVAYGQIIPQTIIELPKYGILNVHASLLPKYRGAAPIQWAIANGETETGVTIMQIDAGLDTGDVLLNEPVTIRADETAPELSERLAPIGAKLLIKVMEEIAANTLRKHKQNAAEATYAPMLKKEDGLIDWARPARHIHNRMRGFAPWPGAYTRFRRQQLVILGARVAERLRVDLGCLHIDKRKLFIGCGEQTALEISELQLAGKKRMSAEAFLNGHQPVERERLGD